MKRTIALLLLVAAGWPSAASAQPPPDAQPTVITLRPAAEPVPALKYRLVPEQIKLVPGNAAIFYHRGVIMMMETYSATRGQGESAAWRYRRPVADRVATGDWLSGPIGEIQRDKARKYLEPFQNALKEVELGALRSTCDWEFDQRTEGMYLLLPEIQEMRGLGRLVAAQGAAGDPRRQDRRGHALDRDRLRDGAARQPGPARDPGLGRHRDWQDDDALASKT